MSLSASLPALRCPLCALSLDATPPVWRCGNGHSFDIAREGYVNLLPVQQKKSRDPGDSADSVRARRAFLEAGHYQPLRDAVVALLRARVPAGGFDALLDIGCGEGYYTSALMPLAGRVTGVDIAKPAVRLAARRFPGATWLVASAAALPLDDASQDVVTSLFSPLPVAEMARVLRPGGLVLAVTPAPDHLWQIRESLFDSVRPHEPDKFLAGFADRFELLAREEVRAPLQLSGTALADLLAMTPYVWKARPERRAALERNPTFATEAAFALLLFRLKPSA